MEKVTFSNGLELPKLGMGVLSIREADLFKTIFAAALDAGFRLFDTAQSYGNEALLGQCIKDGSVPRDQIIITSKLKVANCTYENAKKSFQETLKNLQTDYLDILLIHHPYYDIYGAWRAMEELYKEGYIRAIGISNFQPDRFEDFYIHTDVKPMMHQFQINPYFQQDKLVRLTQKNGVVAEAYSPFNQGMFGIFHDPRLQEIAQAHGKTTAQVMLRWLTQRDIVAIPRSTKPERLIENMDSFSFDLTAEDMEAIRDMEMHASHLPQEFEPYWIDHMSKF